MDMSENRHLPDTWRIFVRQVVIFCFKLSSNIRKNEKYLIFFHKKYSMLDFPENTCMTKNSYEKLYNAIESENQGVNPVFLVELIEKMLTFDTAYHFENWLEQSYDDFNTPYKI